MTAATTIDASRTLPDPDPALAVRAYLVVRESARTLVIDLDEGDDVLFGRSHDATVRIDDGQASREHARVVRRDGALRLVDLGSRNGTRLNDETLRGESRPLRSGDLVCIGAAQILVAQSAGTTSRAGGSRLASELARIAAGGARAVLLRLSLGEVDLARLTSILGAAALLEEQPDGDYACLFDDESAARAVMSEVQRLDPTACVSLARASAGSETAESLWRMTSAASSSAATRPPAPAPPGVVVGDPSMVRVFELVRRLAAAPTTVLILGETGVGKEVIAEQIHRQSARAEKPFVRLNCGSLPETLLESELFGHERGAFTGAERRKLGYIEAAAGGTLFLDEVGELSPTMQTRLLRFLEDKKFMRVGSREEIAADVRIVAATNRDLEAETHTGRFRKDLYFRLSAFILSVPPLRERPAEVELLAELFARQFAKSMGVARPTIAPAAVELLRRHRWPGNVRELKNAIEHAVVLAEQGVLSVAHLPPSLRIDAASSATTSGPMREQLAEMEKRSLQEALDAEHGNQTRAAKRLGISRRGLIYKIEKYGLKG